MKKMESRLEEMDTIERDIWKISKNEVGSYLKGIENRKGVGSDDILLEVWKWKCLGGKVVEFI